MSDSSRTFATRRAKNLNKFCSAYALATCDSRKRSPNYKSSSDVVTDTLKRGRILRELRELRELRSLEFPLFPFFVVFCQKDNKLFAFVNYFCLSLFPLKYIIFIIIQKIIFNMENCNKSINPVVEPLVYDVIISKDNNDICLSLTRYELDSINIFTFIQLGCKVTINVSLVKSLASSYVQHFSND